MAHSLQERTPGSYTEVKEVNITWHYRNADPEFGEYQKNQLLAYLHQMPNTPIDVLNGNKAVEVGLFLFILSLRHTWL